MGEQKCGNCRFVPLAFALVMLHVLAIAYSFHNVNERLRALEKSKVQQPKPETESEGK